MPASDFHPPVTPAEDKVPILFVSHLSDPGMVGGKAAHTVREREAAGYEPKVYLQAIGAGAVNQMVKAIIIAEAKLTETGHEPASKPIFRDEEINGQPRTAIRYRLRATRPT